MHLNAVLARMFMLARKSVSFEIDDLSCEYIDAVYKQEGGQFVNFNNTQAVQEFGIPKGWKKVHNERAFLYSSPNTKIDVFGWMMRFERI